MNWERKNPLGRECQQIQITDIIAHMEGYNSFWRWEDWGGVNRLSSRRTGIRKISCLIFQLDSGISEKFVVGIGVRRKMNEKMKLTLASYG